ncbi:achaete-scute homolog 2 [Suncus etruscus]|uniref:achaete-scute homolog 2 n=1 Tax=Suncus etruscus TaxID=109475 RepID=UPI00210F61F5|nr:achaete-scute homolog 2 [Suncus etruscus]
MDCDALPRTAPPVPGVSGGGCPGRRGGPSGAPELLRCSRRRQPQPGAAEPGVGTGTAAVARRNERERNRVKLVNLGFQALRQHVPLAGATKKLSKVETLRSAAQYIRALQRQLAEHDSARAQGARPDAAAASSPSPRSSSPGSPGSDYLSDDSASRGELSPEERELLDWCWLGVY